ncbi:MAG: hypothetical protein E7166_05630 [Firmicutes bacterium]|nr:hypothetical protein [Bacillota bacterium]
MNEFYDFIDGNFSTMNDMPSNFMYQQQIANQQEAFPQAVQNSIGLPNFNNNFTNMNQNCGMYSPEEGFIRGNMFPNLFDPYKKQQLRRMSGSTEKERLMLNIQTHDFVLKDINLYLDVNPNDNCMIRKYNEYLRRRNELVNEYENKFGPIVLTMSNRSLEGTPWSWVETKSPWKGGK